jgi:WD40 repeat protein
MRLTIFVHFQFFKKFLDLLWENWVSKILLLADILGIIINMIPRISIPPIYVVAINIAWLLIVSGYLLFKRNYRIVSSAESVLLEHTYFINAMAISSDENYLASCGGDDLVIIWTLKNRVLYKRFEYDGWVGNVVFSPNNRLAYSLLGKNGSVSEIDIKRKTKKLISNIVDSPCRGLAITSNGKNMIVCSKKGSFIIMNPIDQNSIISPIKISETELTKVSVYQNESFAIGSKSGEIFYGKLRMQGGKCPIKKIYQDKSLEAVRGISFFDHDHLVYTDSGGKLNLLDINTAEIESQKAHNGHAIAVCVSPNKKFIVTGGQDNRICFWKVKSNHLSKDFEIEGHTDDVTGLLFDHKYHLFSASRDNSIRIWNLKGVNLYK